MVLKRSNDNTVNNGKTDKQPDQATVQYLMKTLKDLQKENEILKREILKSERKPSGKIGSIMLIIGTLTLVGSVVTTSAVLAYIGLGLTFWGALFLFARPIKFVRGSLLDSTAISSYTTIDRITQDLNYKGKPIYIPPYPKEAYLPEYLRGLKEMIVFIPAEDAIVMPTIEEMAKKQFLLKNPKGICIPPPGYGLVSLFERELKAEFTQINLDELYSTLPSIIAHSLELAKEIEMGPENDLIHVKIIDSVYQDLYSVEQNIKSILSIGCPLTSAIACALAKTTGKPIIIAKDLISSDSKTIEFWYQTLEA
ncbi:MAG: hypothetical protein PVF15_05945 [Candidatus Bathyarchaeota archaeon]|jgi:hypothetical protein